MAKTITKTQISNLRQTAKMASNPLRKVAMLNIKIQKLEEEKEAARKEYARYNEWIQQDFGHDLDELMIMKVSENGKGYSLDFNPKYFNVTPEERVDKNGRKMVVNNVKFIDNIEEQPVTEEAVEESIQEVEETTVNVPDDLFVPDFTDNFPEEL